MKKSFFYYKKKLDELNEELTSSMSSLQTNFEQPQHSEHQLGGNTNNNASSSESSSQLFNQTELKETDESRSLDTVGAIVLDMNGHLASAISSGGILLKLPGRVGHASFFGCGCWVDEPDYDLLIDDQEEDESNSIAICTTGCGEYIIKTLFAKECAEHILANTHKPDYDLNEFYKKKFFSMTSNFSIFYYNTFFQLKKLVKAKVYLSIPIQLLIC
jgi:isoaspartyl peptidase/L-asparaginase-like protein (Ntn-hydrolase superfamily)